MKHRKWHLLLRIALLGLLLVTLSCTFSCNDSEFRTFEFTKGIRFSFEYPSHYKVNEVQTSKQEKGAVIVILWDKLPTDGLRYDVIHFGVAKKKVGYTNPEESIAEIIAGLPSEYITEKSTVTMGGIQGELLRYSYRDPGTDQPRYFWSCSPSLKRLNTDLPLIRIRIVAYFDDGDRMWRIEVDTTEKKADQAKADFEHIIQTFKILD